MPRPIQPLNFTKLSNQWMVDSEREIVEKINEIAERLNELTEYTLDLARLQPRRPAW